MSEEDWNEAEGLLNSFTNQIPAWIEKDLTAAVNIAPQQTIYHYTDVKGALGILKSGQLWFTERAHLNDPVEIQYGVDIAHELFAIAARSAVTKIPEEATTHLKGEQVFLLRSFGFWIFSFSMDGDDLSQWRSYADDGRGVCLGFSTSALDINELAKLIPTSQTFLQFPVGYKKKDLVERLRSHIDDAIKLLEKVDLPSRASYRERYGTALLYERDFFYRLNDLVYANSLLFKPDAYENEKEYRLLFGGLRSVMAKCEYHRVRERRGEIVSYLELPIPGWRASKVITHIRVGPAAPHQLEEQLVMTLTTLGIPVPRIERSDIPYRSTRHF